MFLVIVIFSVCVVNISLVPVANLAHLSWVLPMKCADVVIPGHVRSGIEIIFCVMSSFSRYNESGGACLLSRLFSSFVLAYLLKWLPEGGTRSRQRRLREKRVHFLSNPSYKG